MIVDLVNQCRGNQKKLMQMLTSTAYGFPVCFQYNVHLFSEHDPSGFVSSG